MTGITENKQNALFSLWSLYKNSGNVVVRRGEKKFPKLLNITK